MNRLFQMSILAGYAADDVLLDGLAVAPKCGRHCSDKTVEMLYVRARHAARAGLMFLELLDEERLTE